MTTILILEVEAERKGFTRESGDIEALPEADRQRWILIAHEFAIANVQGALGDLVPAAGELRVVTNEINEPATDKEQVRDGGRAGHGPVACAIAAAAVAALAAARAAGTGAFDRGPGRLGVAR